jgi:glycerol kinase
MTQYIAAIDQGTTSTRCILFGHDGKIVASDQIEHAQIFPKPGWVEHNPIEIIENTYSVLRNALQKADLTAKDVASIGITNQRETTIVWNRYTGLPYQNAIVWQDTRTAELCELLARRHGGQDRFRAKTGLPISVYFSGIKLRWLFDHIEGLYEEAVKGNLLFGTVDSWLIWNLTGGPDHGIHCTDVTNASRTMLMNLKTLSWDQEILDELDIPSAILPRILPSSAEFGHCRIDQAEIPITGILGDQQAALFGQTCFTAGEVKNTYGTGCFMLLNTGSVPVQSKNGLITTVGYQIGSLPPVYCLEGSIAVTGALVQWLRDNLKLITSSSEIESLAREVPDNGDVYIVPAFSGLFAPYWRSDARGIIVGLTRFANRGHIARAVLEATAFQTQEVLEAMEKDSGVNIRMMKVDGGMVVNELLMQFQSDILGVPIVRPQVAETTALGAAYAAGLAIGYWKSLSELRDNWAIDKTWIPQMDADQRIRLCIRWKKAVSKSFDWV